MRLEMSHFPHHPTTPVDDVAAEVAVRWLSVKLRPDLNDLTVLELYRVCMTNRTSLITCSRLSYFFFSAFLQSHQFCFHLPDSSAHSMFLAHHCHLVSLLSTLRFPCGSLLRLFPPISAVANSPLLYKRWSLNHCLSLFYLTYFNGRSVPASPSSRSHPFLISIIAIVITWFSRLTCCILDDPCDRISLRTAVHCVSWLYRSLCWYSRYWLIKAGVSGALNQSTAAANLP